MPTHIYTLPFLLIEVGADATLICTSPCPSLLKEKKQTQKQLKAIYLQSVVLVNNSSKSSRTIFVLPIQIIQLLDFFNIVTVIKIYYDDIRAPFVTELGIWNTITAVITLSGVIGRALIGSWRVFYIPREGFVI